MEDVSSYEPYLQGIYGAFVNADCVLRFLVQR